MLNNSATQVPDVCVSEAEAHRIAAEDNEVLAAAECCTDLGAGDAGCFAAWLWWGVVAAVTVAASALVVLLLLLAPSARAHGLPPEVVEACEADGGCKLISREAMMQQLQRAYRAGQGTCESKL